MMYHDYRNMDNRFTFLLSFCISLCNSRFSRMATCEPISLPVVSIPFPPPRDDIPEEDYRESERIGMDVHSYRALKAFEEEHVDDNAPNDLKENREAINTYDPEKQFLTRPTSGSNLQSF